MNPALLIIGFFDWRGALARGVYRRNMSILVLVSAIVRWLDLLHGGAFLAWTAAVWMMALSLNARRYHDMGRSAAWIVWANVIAAAVTIVAFQFAPNLLTYVPLPVFSGLDSGSQAVLGRFVLPAIVGAFIGNFMQAIWLAYAPSFAGPNPYAAQTPAPAKPGAKRDDDTFDEAAAQAIIDRHLAARQTNSATVAAAAVSAPLAAPGVNAPRAFGKRRA
ncbi:MAG TPA: hypothetical protein VKS78_10035 [Roseiarcus sp.]|nr:hypothetical protein [Roseiarcus sp.]